MIPISLEEQFVRFNARKFDEIIFELSLVKGSNQELKYENPAGSITIKTK